VAAGPRRPSGDDPDEYQSKIRNLKKQLKKLRDEGAEAV
jgi:ribosomal protein L19E